MRKVPEERMAKHNEDPRHGIHNSRQKAHGEVRRLLQHQIMGTAGCPVLLRQRPHSDMPGPFAAEEQPACLSGRGHRRPMEGETCRRGGGPIAAFRTHHCPPLPHSCHILPTTTTTTSSSSSSLHHPCWGDRRPDVAVVAPGRCSPRVGLDLGRHASLQQRSLARRLWCPHRRPHVRTAEYIPLARRRPALPNSEKAVLRPLALILVPSRSQRGHGIVLGDKGGHQCRAAVRQPSDEEPPTPVTHDFLLRETSPVPIRAETRLRHEQRLQEDQHQPPPRPARRGVSSQGLGHGSCRGPVQAVPTSLRL
mmetsp:Transcript_21448/g.62493  ORF Transcript_21448/g.62493 Transcript_21448/m.62493 type:complete len:308 (-) Transcript_21448:105-1028(-)